MAFMPEHALLVMLALLGTCFLGGLAALALAGAWIAGKRDWAKGALAIAVILAGSYFAILIAFSLKSHERVLRVGEQKYFCEMDCHEAYAVAEVSTRKTLGPPGNEIAAKGKFYVVAVKVWFDERTISSRRGNGPLDPNPHEATIVDQSGRRCRISDAGQARLEQVQGKTIPFTTPIRPGESYKTTLVFDLPADVRNPRLYITTEPWLTQFLIGHENSFFHKKVLFELEPQSRA